MTRYTHTFTANVNVPKPDMTMEMELWVTATPEQLSATNELLSRFRKAAKDGQPYPAGFAENAEIIDEWESELPEFDFSDHIVIEAMDIRQVAPVLNTLSIIYGEYPEIGYKGEIWLKNRLLGGARVTYEIVAAPNSREMNIQQRYLENQTYHHKPSVTGYFE